MSYYILPFTLLVASLAGAAIHTDDLIYNFSQNGQATNAWTSEAPGSNTSTVWNFTGNHTQGTVTSDFNGISQAYNLSGGSASLSLNTAMNALAEDMTIEIWLKPSSLNGGKQVILTSGAAYRGYSLTLWNDTIHWVAKGGQSSSTSPSGDLTHVLDAAAIGDYIQIVATIDNREMQLFVNPRNTITPSQASATGTAGGTGSIVGSNNTKLGNKTTPIGGGDNATGQAWSADQFSAFSGDLAILRAYDDALTGNEVAANFETYATFESSAPTVTAFTPSNNTSDASIFSNLIITFNKSISAGFGNITLHRASDNSIIETIAANDTNAVTINGSQVTVKISNLSLSTAYYVQVNEGAFVDLDGNNYAGISDPTFWSFTTSATTPPPNIIIVMADDMVWRDCSPYYDQPGGHATGDMPGDLTPNMQTLSNQGMRFDTFQSATALCSPFRQQLFTGIYPSRSGALPNHGRVKAGTKSIVHHLEDLGYRVGLMGKRHINPSSSYPFEYLTTASNTDTEDLNNIAAADQFITRNDAEPYCLVITSNNPHGPLDSGNYVADNSTLPVTDDILDINQYRTSYNKYLAEVKEFDAEVGYWMEAVQNGPNPNNTIFVCLTEHGANIPSTKYSCYEAGLRSGCIVRWPSQVEANVSTDAIVEAIDVLPTLLDAAGGNQPTGLERLDGLSFLGLLQGETDQHKKYAYGVHTSRGVNGQDNEGYAIRSIRDARYKLIWNLQPHLEMVQKSGVLNYWKAMAEGTQAATPEEQAFAQILSARHWGRPEYQFYDLLNDPFELNDLHAEAEYGAKIALLQTKLERWMASQRDRGILTEKSIVKYLEEAGATSLVPVADEVHPYDSWVNTYAFIWHQDRAFSADPDDDGFNNQLEWIYGTNPLLSSDSPSEACKIENISTSISDALVDLSILRRRHFESANLVYNLESSSSLINPSWQTVNTTLQGIELLDDESIEKAMLQLNEPTNSNANFYRVSVAVPTDYTGGPTLYYSGTSTTQNATNLGDLQSQINNTNISITIEATLPNQAPPSGSAELLWKSGDNNGISLVLLENQIVFSAQNTNDINVLNLLGTLDSSDFGKQIFLRLNLEHKVSKTLFNLSAKVTDGSSFMDANLSQTTGYIGTGDTRFGDLNGDGNFPGLIGSPSGILDTELNGVSNILPWSAGDIKYEILGTIPTPIN